MDVQIVPLGPLAQQPHEHPDGEIEVAIRRDWPLKLKKSVHASGHADICRCMSPLPKRCDASRDGLVRADEKTCPDSLLARCSRDARKYARILLPERN